MDYLLLNTAYIVPVGSNRSGFKAVFTFSKTLVYDKLR
jgi:hypothetical protein